MRFHCLDISGGSGDNTASRSAAAALECIYRVIVSVGEVLCLEDSSWLIVLLWPYGGWLDFAAWCVAFGVRK